MSDGYDLDNPKHENYLDNLEDRLEGTPMPLTLANEKQTMSMVENAILAPAKITREQIVNDLEPSARWADLDYDGGQYWVSLDTAADMVLAAHHGEVL